MCGGHPKLKFLKTREEDQKVKAGQNGKPVNASGEEGKGVEWERRCGRNGQNISRRSINRVTRERTNVVDGFRCLY